MPEAVAAETATPEAIDRYAAQFSRVWDLRQSGGWDSHWKMLAQVIKPRRARFTITDQNKGNRTNESIFDNTGTTAHRTLRAGMHSGMTSPARPWMKLTTPDPELAEHGQVKQWLHIVTQRMLTIFGQSNLYKTLPVCYGDLGLFGTGAIGILDGGDRDLFRSYPYAVGTYAIGLDEQEKVTTFARKIPRTVRQIVEAYGLQPNRRDINWGKLPLAIKTAWEKSEYETLFTVCWLVTPNKDASATAFYAKDRMPFRSCHWIEGERELIRESGYETFPVMVPRWEVTDGDPYGNDCPGMTALGDVRQLQKQMKKKGWATEKWIDPNMTAPPSMRMQRPSLLAGEVNYIALGEEGLFKPSHEINLAGFQYYLQDMEETRDRIREAFFYDLFRMLELQESVQPKTAREVQELHEEKMIQLGPVLEQCNEDLFDPLVDRVFGMMMKHGLVPEWPEELNGVDLKVEYTSILSQAQKLIGVSSLNGFVDSSLVVLKAYPEARHIIDPIKLIQGYGDMYGIDPRHLRTEDDAAELADKEAKAQQVAQAAANSESFAKAGKNAAETPMEGDSALTRLLQGAGQ